MAGSSESAQGETKDKDKKGPKRRPKRYCIFCSSYQSSLRRHINNKHSKDSYFKELKERFRKMHPDSAKGQHMLFDEIRKLGIQKINEERKGGNQGIVTERSITYDAAQCKICKAYYCQSTYAAHFRNCRRKLVKVSEKSSIWKSQTLPICSENISEDLKQFLAKGKYDEVTEVIRNDPIILNFAEKRLKNITQFFPQKAGEQRKTLKNRLRALGRTFLTFNEKLAIDRVPRKNHDIFDPRNIHYLMESIKEFGTPNMHAQSYFVIIGALNALITYYKNSANNEGYSNIIETLESTRELLSREKKNIQDKQCEYMNTRRVTNVCTNELIDDDDFNRLKDWCERELEKYLGMIDDKVSIKSEQYAEIRKLVITGITFLNARRANEPSRMLISEYKKVVKEKGLDTLAPSKLRICEQEPHQTISVNVHMSKGRPSHGRMVPVVLPLYVIPAMNFLCEPEVRKRNSVNVGNKFVFPMTKNSLEHAQGNKDIRELCNRAGLPKPITSTQIRYYMAAKMRKKSDLPKDEPQD